MSLKCKQRKVTGVTSVLPARVKLNPKIRANNAVLVSVSARSNAVRGDKNVSCFSIAVSPVTCSYKRVWISTRWRALSRALL